jgi:hypothetical protein
MFMIGYELGRRIDDICISLHSCYLYNSTAAAEEDEKKKHSKNNQ